MTRKSRRELEHAVETLGSDAADVVDLASGWSVAYGDEEPPEREPAVAGAGYEIYADTDTDAEVDPR